MKRILLFLLLPLALPLGGRATVREISMRDAITLARAQSVSATVSLNKLRAAYWQYRSHRANLLPEVAFNGNIPIFKRGFNQYQGPDGKYSFIRTNSLRMNGELTVDQNIPWTGGKIGISTSLERLQSLGDNGQTRYMSIPVGLTLTQPIFAVNTLAWQNKIEPLRYEEAKKRYLSDVEDITREAISRYFSLLIAESRLLSARQNETNALKLYGIAKVKRQNGDLSANGLRQLQLNWINAKSSLTEEETNWKAKMFRLQAYLGIPSGDTIRPITPENVPNVRVQYDDVLRYALQNNASITSLQRRRVEAQYDVAHAKGERYKVDLFGSIGYTGTSDHLAPSYSDLIDYQEARLGVRIPLLDWGKRGGKVKMAQWRQQMVEAQVKQDQQNFEQTLFLIVERYNNQGEQLNRAALADTIAEARYKTSIEVFMTGQIGVLELNDAQQSKDRARERHIYQLYLYWDYFYQIRSWCLHDFTGIMPFEDELESLMH